MASVSYDTVAILRNFAERKHITFPMLADPDSKMIRAFGILNESVAKGTAFYGIPYPGTFILDERGVVRSKYFERDSRDRYTAANLVVTQFGDTGGLRKTVVETPHLTLSYAESDPVAQPGSIVALVLEIEMKPRIHLYAPGVQGYIPIDWKVTGTANWRALPVSYPAARKLHLPVIQETVPVYEGHLRLVRGLSLGQMEELKAGKFTVDGSFRYQACDDRECYPPQVIPLKWAFQVAAPDQQRVPAGLQRK